MPKTVLRLFGAVVTPSRSKNELAAPFRIRRQVGISWLHPHCINLSRIRCVYSPAKLEWYSQFILSFVRSLNPAQRFTLFQHPSSLLAKEDALRNSTCFFRGLFFAHTTVTSLFGTCWFSVFACLWSFLTEQTWRVLRNIIEEDGFAKLDCWIMIQLIAKRLKL